MDDAKHATCPTCGGRMVWLSSGQDCAHWCCPWPCGTAQRGDPPLSVVPRETEGAAELPGMGVGDG